jgi:hypothetical protein
MSKSIKIRFNLGRGKNYLKWKIEYPNGEVSYIEPDGVQLVMRDCTFKNYRKTAQKIYDGADKTVCAWILCKQIEIRTDNFITEEQNRAYYNPRVQPNWVMNDVVVDGKTAPQLHTINRGVFLTCG